MNTCILHLGSNLGDRADNLSLALEGLSTEVRIINTSRIYLTEAWGVEDQPDFYNQAATVETELHAFEVLDLCRRVGATFPEKEGEQWGPRYIDIDIIFFNDEIIDTELLKIPHPRLHLRNFVLIPLLEIAADMVHPVLHKTIETLYVESTDKLEVILLEETT